MKLEIYKGEPVAGTFLISQGFDRQHKKVTELIEKYDTRFLTFMNNKSLSKGLIKRTVRTEKAGRPIEEYLLNEQQFMFLGTLFRNTDKVLDFKQSLIHEYHRMKKSLSVVASNQANEEWRKVRAEGKVPRRIETDKIKEFIDYAISQGSKSAEKYYMAISKMENKHLFLIEKKYPNLREVLGVAELDTVKQADHIVAKALQDGMMDSLHYKEIYKMASDRVKMFAEIRGQSVIDMLEKQQ